MTDIDWELLGRYLAGVCTDGDRARLERWLDEAPEHRAIVEQARALALRARRDVAPGKVADMWASLRRDIDAAEAGALTPRLRVLHGPVPEPEPRIFSLPRPRARWLTGLRASAAAVVLLASSLLIRQVLLPSTDHPKTSPVAPRTIATARGERLAVRLADGTQVSLGPETTLRVAAEYGARERTVHLDGEAAFTVKHDTARPFAVHTNRTVARDLGTRFVVRAYRDDPTTEVVVAEGVVEVDTIVITPGQGVQVAADGRPRRARDVSLDRYFGWTTGALVFRDTPLDQVAAELGRWYDIDVRLGSPDIARRRLTARSQDELADDVVEMIAVSLNLRVTRTGRTYTLHAR